MAVWGTDTHKLDIVKELYKIGPDLPSRIFGERLNPFLTPNEELTGLRKSDVWEELALKLGWETDVTLDETREELLKYIEGVGNFQVGTPAVYSVINACRLARFNTAPQYDYDMIYATLQVYKQFLCPSTQITPSAFNQKYDFRDETARTKSRRYEGLAECFKRLRVTFFKQEYDEVDQKKYFGEGIRHYTLVRAGGLLFMRGTSELTTQCLVFTRAHVDQVVGCSQRLSNIYAYLGSTWSGQDLENGMSFLEFQIETASKARGENAYKVAKAFHKARAMMQMILLKSVLPECIAGEIADYNSAGLEGVLRLAKFNAQMYNFRPVRRVEALHFYKWMPSPDFDTTRILGVVKSYHDNPRSSGCDPGASDRMKHLWERVKAERKLHLAYAINRMSGQWPSGLVHRHSGPTVADALAWDHRSVLPYYTLGKDIVSQVKDKQTVAAMKNAELAGKGRADETSYLLWYLKNKDMIDTDEILADFPFHGEDNYTRVAYKAESHKPESRLFYMAPPKTRTILGELEGNLSNIAKVYPGCLMGKSASEKKKILLDIMDPYSPLPGVQAGEDCETFIIQFDLAKFSPKSNFNVTKDYHEFWSEVFGVPKIANLVDIGCKGHIIHNTCGLKMEYKNEGPDLEGFRGRMMTMFHADMLGAACREARNEGLLHGRSKLAVFVDDGVVKVAVHGTGDEAVKNVRKFLEILRDVYASAGQDVNPSKTCVSRVGGEMLAEFYFNCTQMPTGIKAAMRLYPDYENAATTITEEFDGLFSTAQGIVKDGGDWLAAHHMYVEAILKSINRWARREFVMLKNDLLALALMTPKSYGGFGVQPLQGLVTTAVTNLTAEGLAMLNRACKWMPGYRKQILSIVTQPVIKRDPLSILRDPLRVRADCPVLMENRLVMAVVDWLENQEGTIGGFVGEYKGQTLRDHARQVAEALFDSDHISLPVVERVWKSTPLCQVESIIAKFKRSSTVIRFLGREALSKIRKCLL